MSKRDSKHVRAQRMARLRDNNVCLICGSRSHTEGHHAFDYQYGGSSSLENIVTLCKECHNKVHRGDIDIYSL